MSVAVVAAAWAPRTLSGELPQRCLAKHNIDTSDAFGINVVTLPEGAAVPALSKRLCATACPGVPVQYGDVALNVLNMTTSREQCLALYTLVVCQPGYPYEMTVDCRHASHIAHAFIQMLPACSSDAHCNGGGRLHVPHIHCKWGDAIRKDVCPRSTLPLQCITTRSDSFALDSNQACALTSPLCATIITYTDIIATLAAVTYFVVIAVVICSCSASRKNAAIAACVDKITTTPEIVYATQK